MKKDFKDLTIEEFVRVICDVPKIYEFEVRCLDEKGIRIDDERDFIKGDYWTLHDFFNNCLISSNGNTRSFASGAIKQLEESVFDYTLEYSFLDIYEYIENKTKCFDIIRCNILLNDLDYYKFLIAEELEVDYEKYKYKFFDYYRAVDILRGKIGLLNDKAPQQGKQSPTLPKKLDTEEAKAVLQRAVGIILDENYQLLPETTGGQAYAFVLCAKEELKLKGHFKIFGDFWGKRNLKNKKLSDTSEEKIKIVKKLFPNYISHNALKDKT